MNRTLKENCKWLLTWNGELVSEGLDDGDLDSYLLNHLEDLKIDGAILYSKEPIDFAREKINNIKTDVAASKVKRINYDDISEIGDDNDEIEQLEYVSFAENSLSVTKAINHLNVEGSPLVTPMSIDDWKRNKKKELEDKVNKSTATDPTGKVSLVDFIMQNQISTDELIEMERKSWYHLTQIGTSAHEVFQDIFKGKTPEKHNLPDFVFNSLVSQITKFKESIEEKYPGCEFYPELQVKSKNLSPDMMALLEAQGKDSITGTIDLLVIDANGNAHIYDYKISRKNIGIPGESVTDWWDITGNIEIRNNKLWASAKKLNASYQLEFYRQMLQQYGLNVSDTNVIPVKLDLEYKNEKNPFEITGVSNVEVNYKKDQYIKNPGKRNNGKVAAKIQRLFMSLETIAPEDIEAITRAHAAFFPSNSVITKRENLRSKVEYYKKQDRYVHKLKPGDYNYGKEGKDYRISFKGYKTVYCTESELDGKIQEYINKQAEAQSTKCLDIANAIKNIKNGDSEDDEELVGLVGNNQKSFVRNIFKPYLSDDWFFDYDETSASIGLFKFRKGDKVDILCISTEALRGQLSDFNLNVKNKNWKGTSILGKTKSDKNINTRDVLPALTGNVEIMKAMTYISLHPELFENLKISEIKAINPWAGIELSSINSTLIDNFNELVKENPDSGVKKIRASLFLKDEVALVETAKKKLVDLAPMLESGSTDINQDHYTAAWFKNKIDLVEKKYGAEMNLQKGYQDTPIWNAYVKLKEGYNIVRGFKSHIETDKSDYAKEGKYLTWNGLMVTSPQFSSSANIRELAQVIDEYAKEVRRQVYELGAPIQQSFIKLYNKHGVGSKVFDSWFADKSKLILKDPDSSEFDGDPESRETLKLFLKTLAKLRHPDLKTDEDFEAVKNDEDYYAIPLIEAKFSRQIKKLSLWKVIKNKIKENYTITEGLFMGQEPTEDSISGYVSENQELYNKMKFDNMEARQARLDEFGPELFETNLEVVMNAALVAFSRTNVSKEYIPCIAGLKLALEYADTYGSSDKTKGMENIRETFDKIVKSKFYGESIVPKSLHGLLKFINLIKSGFTTLTLSLNARSLLRESLQGIYTGLSRANVKLYPGINKENYIAGLTHVIQESYKNFSGVSQLQQINAIYGMANQSLNQLADGRRVKWAHINNWGKDTLFLTATSPDFMHRMGLLVAKMMADGCWEAHSLDDKGVLKYDFKKDKRFEHFVNKDTSNENYLKEKALYETMIDDFNRSGFRNADGSLLNAEKMDALPQAYTRREGQSIKNYADFLYGHYDDESKSLLCDTFLGSIFLQYKTYITAKLEQWTIDEGVYNMETLQAQLDDDGKQMYVRFYEDEDGTPHKDVLLESEYNALSEDEQKTCRLYFAYTGIPLNGMLHEALNVSKKLITLDSNGLKEIWSDPTTRIMFKLQIHDLWVMMLMTLFTTFLFGKIVGAEDPLNGREIRRLLKKSGPIENFAYNVITGSLADSQLPNIIQSFTDKPPVISAVNRFGYSSLNAITGQTSITHWLTQNVGAFRDFQGITKNTD